ncbi:MAG: sugar ABC transporter permease [Clostridia bacterium]|nr:sugar ABC transporter permease [Clostridia bacterium]
MVESKQQWKAWLYLAPAIVLLLIFTVWPIINTVAMAFMEDYSGLAKIGGESSFRFGFGNFVKVAQNAEFKQALTNTIFLCLITVPVSTILALLIAVALHAIKPLQKALQTIFFLPYVTNSIAIGMVFAAMFNVIGSVGTRRPLISSYGIVNDIIRFFGGNWVNWINSGSDYWANMFVLIVYIVWNALPFKILILLGGLTSINKQYYEAAKVDSTPRWRVLTRITVPLLSPMLAYVVITGFIAGFKEYTSIVGIFGESMGPVHEAHRLNTMVGLIYDSLASNNQGRASAAALILFGIILVVTLINLWVSKKRVHY